jgi:hypothetical protein
MDSLRPASGSLEISIKNSHLYNRAWLMENLPGMHNDRLIELQKNFGLLPLGSGNRHAPYLFRGKNILDALEAEARFHRGNSTEESEPR